MISAGDIIEDILRREGSSFTSHAADRGGPTRWGITQATLAEHRGHPVSPAEVAALTKAEAWTIYERMFIVAPRFIEIRNGPLLGLVVDTAVLHGRGRAARWLQEAIGGLKVDGQIGDKTLAAIAAGDARQIFARLLARRLRGIADLVQSEPTQLRWLEGWVNRCNEFVTALAAA